MANIQTIRLVYNTHALSEKEWLKTFLEFIGIQIIEERIQTLEQLNNRLQRAKKDYDLDIWLNLSHLIGDDIVYSNVIVLDYFFSKKEGSSTYFAKVCSKKESIQRRKLVTTSENVSTKESLRKTILSMLIEQIWYEDTEKQEDIKFVLDLYLKHNIFVCMQSLVSISLAVDPEHCLPKADTSNVMFPPSSFWIFCIDGFVNFFNELEPVSQETKTVYAIYAYANSAIIYQKVLKHTWDLWSGRCIIKTELDGNFLMAIVNRMIDIDPYFVGSYFLGYCISENYDYLCYIDEILRGRYLNNSFGSRFATMLGDYFYLHGNKSISLKYYEKALELNENDIQARYMLAICDVKRVGFDGAINHLSKVLKMLGSSVDGVFNVETTDYYSLYKTLIWFSKIYYNRGQKECARLYIECALMTVSSYQEGLWIGKIIDDEPIWRLLKKHYKYGIQTKGLCDILYRWADDILSEEYLREAIKSIMPPEDAIG